MRKPETDENDVRMSDVLCDFCHREWVEEIAMVGDDPEKDLAGARAVGLAAIDVRDIRSLSELPQALRDPATFVA